MPEKPEVITVAKKLSLRTINRKIEHVKVLWPNIIEGMDHKEFEKRLRGEVIESISTRGKWLVFSLSTCLLLVHLRMEGKFFYRTKDEEVGKHEHVIFTLDNGEELRFQDVRKFGKMRILNKENMEEQEPISSLGLEVWDKNLTPSYLKEKWQSKKLPMKSLLLEQSVITGIGNIYADEILFLSHIHPLTKALDLTEENLIAIIENARSVLDKAILEGGTTIRSYTSEEGVSGLFQNHLWVHQREKEECRICGCEILKIKVGGRGTYFCKKCQQELSKK